MRRRLEAWKVERLEAKRFVPRRALSFVQVALLPSERSYHRTSDVSLSSTD
jgi:hypothetical protein